LRYLERVATEEELREVKRRHSMRLLQLPGVSGVGVEKDSAGNYVLVVHVDAQQPASATNVPETLEGHPVLVKRSGPFRPIVGTTGLRK